MKKTCLYDQHVHHNAHLVPFANYLMPLYYDSIANEHKAVRQRVGIFDVSHMGEIYIGGPDSLKFVNYLLTNHIPLGPSMKSVYCLMCDQSGKVVDDLIVYPLDKQQYLLVVNASNLDKDFDWISTHKQGFDVDVRNLSETIGQIALQGPHAEIIAASFFGVFVTSLKFMEYTIAYYQNEKVLISRSGYTGEDGFEFYGPHHLIEQLWIDLIEQHQVIPCGLGCRDTLRFEAALSLYGHEISDTISPLEAGLSFVVKLDKQFIGQQPLRKEKEVGSLRKLVGLQLIGRGIAREGYEIFANETKIGHVTTGYLLPEHADSLALALIDTKYALINQPVHIKIRQQLVPAFVRDMNFMDKKYKR